MKTTLLMTGLALLLAACQTEAPGDIAAHALYEHYGNTITSEGAVPVQAVVAEVDQHTGKAVKLEGTVHEVCQMAGCWLTLDAGGDQYIRINVPRDADGNYVYTVPTDISGRRAVVQGYLETVALDDATREHLAHDAEGHHDDDGAGHHAGGDNEGHDGDGAAHNDADGHHEGDGDAGHDEGVAHAKMANAELQMTAEGILIEKAKT